MYGERVRVLCVGQRHFIGLAYYTRGIITALVLVCTHLVSITLLATVHLDLVVYVQPYCIDRMLHYVQIEPNASAMAPHRINWSRG